MTTTSALQTWHLCGNRSDGLSILLKYNLVKPTCDFVCPFWPFLSFFSMKNVLLLAAQDVINKRAANGAIETAYSGVTA